MRRLVVAVVSSLLSVSVPTGPVAASGPMPVNCQNGASLQAAIDAASPGDTLIRVKGTCTGNFVISKDLNLVGKGVHPTLDGGGSGTVVEVPVGPGGIQTVGATVRISGLTIKGGDLGIHDRGTMTVIDTAVRGNGRGIYVELDIGVSGGGLILRHSRVNHNGTGIFNDSWRLLVRNSIIADNSGAGLINGIQKISTIRSSTVRGNGGTGIVIGGSLQVYDSVIRDNQGGGIAGRDFLLMRRSRVVDNSSPGNGGGISVTSLSLGGAIDIADSVIKDNVAAGLGGGIYVSGGGMQNMQLAHVTVRNNTAGTDGGGIYEAGGGSASLTDVTFRHNSPNDCTGC